ncbi:MAG TPA: hypothetical protein VF414_21220, partial [Thermoanaerobaculia bacterium]
REETLDWLTTNCRHLKGDQARDTLDELPDEALAELRANSEFAAEKTLVCNALATVLPEINDVVANGGDIEAFLKSKMGAKDEEEEDMEEDEYEENEDCGEKKGSGMGQLAEEDHQMKSNAQKVEKAPSLTEYIKRHGTPEERAVWNSAVKVEREQRVKLLRQLTANVEGDDRRKAVWDALKAKPLDELELLLNLRGPAREEAAPSRGLFGSRIPDYAGASGGFVGNRQVEEDDDPLGLPGPHLLTKSGN